MMTIETLQDNADDDNGDDDKIWLQWFLLRSVCCLNYLDSMSYRISIERKKVVYLILYRITMRMMMLLMLAINQSVNRP